MAHTWLGYNATSSGPGPPPALRRLVRWRLLSPSRHSKSPMVLGAGQLCSGYSSANFALSLHGPKLGQRRRNSTISAACAGAIAHPT